MLDTLQQSANTALATALLVDRNMMLGLVCEEIGHAIMATLVAPETASSTSAILFGKENGAFAANDVNQSSTEISIMAGPVWRYLSVWDGKGLNIEYHLSTIINNPFILLSGLSNNVSDFRDLKFKDRLTSGDANQIHSIVSLVAASGCLYLALRGEALTAIVDGVIAALGPDESGIVTINNCEVVKLSKQCREAMEYGITIADNNDPDQVEILLENVEKITPSMDWVSSVIPMEPTQADAILAMPDKIVRQMLLATKH